MSKILNLFEELNLKSKNKDKMDLDDFLYLLDNFSFFLKSEDEYINFVNYCF